MNQSVFSETGAANMPGVHIGTFRSLVSAERIKAVYSRTVPHQKKPGFALANSPDNVEWLLVEEVERLKRELEQEKEEDENTGSAKQKIDPKSGK